ncbi:MAG: hypothetical protein QOE72_381 [Chloroflexota bacterium]|nr:hypothetical protein [Chloroflexota bacterium]
MELRRLPARATPSDRDRGPWPTPGPLRWEDPGVMVTARTLGCAAITLLAACGGTTGVTPSPSSHTAASASSCGHSTNGVHIALAVTGAPDPNSSTFREDQQNLYDPSQFSDPQLYPPGYHWKLDTNFSPMDVIGVKTFQTNPGGVGAWAVDLGLTPAATERFHADAAAAGAAPVNTPESRIAFFVGPRVVSAPTVVAPPTGSDAAVGFATQAQAEAIADQIGQC